MLKRDTTAFFIVILPILLSSCAVFKKQIFKSYFKKTEDSKAVQLNFKEPPFPYTKQKHNILDDFWLNKKKGSSISYFSSCSQVPRSLKTFQTSSYPGNLNYKILKRIKTAVSFYSLLLIENQSLKESNSQTHIAVYTLKNKNCFFNINLVAPSQKVFEEESKLFQNFIQNFKPL